MKVIVRHVDPVTKSRLKQEPAAIIQITAKTALVEIEGRQYEIELGPEIAKAIHLDDGHAASGSEIA